MPLLHPRGVYLLLGFFHCVCLLLYLENWLVVASSLSGPSSPVVRQSGDCGRFNEVRPCTFGSSSVPWHGNRHVSRASDSISGSYVTLQGGIHIFSSPSFSASMHVAAATRPHVVSGAFSSRGTHSHAAPPVADEGQLVASGRRPSQPNPLVSGLCGSSQMVASGGPMDVRCASTCSAPIPVVVYRRVLVGVGGTSSRSHDLGCLVRGGVPGAHQRPRDEGSGAGSGIISSPASRAECRPDE